MFSGAPIGSEALSCLPVRHQPGPRLGGIGLSGAVPFVSPKGVRPLAEAIQFRVFAVTGTRVTPGVFGLAQRVADRLFRSFLSGVAEPMDTWEWICSMPSRRRKELVRVWRKYQERGLEPSHKYDRIQAFVKNEKLPYLGVKGGEYDASYAEYVARLIQAPHDETHLDAGRYLKPLVKRLKRDWSWDNWLFYASVAPSTLDHWLQKHHDAASWFWADYSAFDATYSPGAWQLIESFYARLYPDADPRFWRALDVWRTPNGDCRLRKDEARIRYQAAPMNASGRDDTALANALFNGIALALSIAAAIAQKDVMDLEDHDIERMKQVVNIAVVGDDSLVALSLDVEPIADAIVANLGKFGLSVKSQFSRDLVDVTFLAMMPYPVAGTYYWGPTLGRRLYKAYWQEDPVGNLPAWTLGVAKQLALYQHVPILVDMAERIISLLPGGKITRFKRDENRVWAARDTATPRYDASTLAWLARRYDSHGLSPAQIVADINTIRGITRLPAVVRLHTTDYALAVDDL